MLLNILTIALGLSIGYIIILLIQWAIDWVKHLIYNKSSKYKIKKVYSYANKQYEQVVKEDKIKK